MIAPGLLERIRSVAEHSFERMSYTEAIRHLEAAPSGFNYPVSWGADLQTEHERYLCEQVVGGPVFILDYPRAIKAFYMRDNDDGRTVAAMDLLVPGVGELIGGSQRKNALIDLIPRCRPAVSTQLHSGGIATHAAGVAHPTQALVSALNAF